MARIIIPKVSIRQKIDKNVIENIVKNTNHLVPVMYGFSYDIGFAKILVEDHEVYVDIELNIGDKMVNTICRKGLVLYVNVVITNDFFEAINLSLMKNTDDIASSIDFSLLGLKDGKEYKISTDKFLKWYFVLEYHNADMKNELLEKIIHGLSKKNSFSITTYELFNSCDKGAIKLGLIDGFSDEDKRTFSDLGPNDILTLY